eukprot:3739762-Rhodomonas_salina.1
MRASRSGQEGLTAKLSSLGLQLRIVEEDLEAELPEEGVFARPGDSGIPLNLPSMNALAPFQHVTEGAKRTWSWRSGKRVQRRRWPVCMAGVVSSACGDARGQRPVTL